MVVGQVVGRLHFSRLTSSRSHLHVKNADKLASSLHDWIFVLVLVGHHRQSISSFTGAAKVIAAGKERIHLARKLDLHGHFILRLLLVLQQSILVSLDASETMSTLEHPRKCSRCHVPSHVGSFSGTNSSATLIDKGTWKLDDNLEFLLIENASGDLLIRSRATQENIAGNTLHSNVVALKNVFRVDGFLPAVGGVRQHGVVRSRDVKILQKLLNTILATILRLVLLLLLLLGSTLGLLGRQLLVSVFA